MNKFYFVLFLCSLLINGNAQEIFEGTIYDVGTHEELSNVEIRTSNTRITAWSNSLGEFTIYFYPIDSAQEDAETSFTILNNKALWKSTEALEIKLYSINGMTILSRKTDNEGSLQLPILSVGYYVLNVNSNLENNNYLLFSDGASLRIVRANNYSSGNAIYDSSLYFSLSNYYIREVLLNPGENPISINLLKKHYENLGYFNELINHEAFYMLHSSPPKSNYGEIQSIKALYDFVDDKIYYSNIKKYQSHFSFAESILGYENGSTAFFYSQYNNNPDRYLHLVTINYHTNIDKYVFEFAPYDMVDCEGIKETYQKILKTSFFKDKLYFHTNNLRWQNCLDIPLISSEELYLGQNYQALNIENNYGYLRKISISDLPASYLGKHDIILLNGIPNDLSVVSGIITTVFQTPLSHINILSHNRQTPNMALKDGWTDPILDSLMGELVYLEVNPDSFNLRKANIEEATIFWNQKEPQTPITLEMDIETSGLIELNSVDISSVNKIGGKAANFSELVNLESIPLPENYFAIPFYYYHQHIVNNGIDTIISNMLDDSLLISNLEYRQEKLNMLKDLIRSAPIDMELVNAVSNRIDNFSEFSSFRFRSSTNAEDLENFSGAGLYDSYSAKKNHSTKTVENIIRKVWASLWNLRAFDEREYYKINQNSVAMGILVHRSFPDEDANGVIITKNLYNVNHAYTFNVQYKEYSIVAPEPGIMHDQILVYTINLGGNNYTIEYLSQSNIPELGGQTVLTNEEIYELADYCTIIKQHYYNNIPHNCNCDYATFAVDIELKVDSQVEERKIYLKQVRIYGSN